MVLSLAKFMTAGSLSFDILVIDQASQMRPEDAFAKQIVERRFTYAFSTWVIKTSCRPSLARSSQTSRQFSCKLFP